MSMHRHGRSSGRTKGLLGATVALAMLLAACGSEPATSGGGQTGGGGGQTGGGGGQTDPGDDDGIPEDPEERLAYLSALEGEERATVLQELAAEESGTLTWYTGHQENEYQPVADAFEAEYGITVEVFRASAADMAVRVMEEWSAGGVGADILEQGQFNLQIYRDAGILADWDSPEREFFTDDFKLDYAVGTKALFFVAAWNEGLLGEPLPATYYELLQEMPDRPEDYSFITSDEDWFGTLVKYFMETEGISEEEAIELFAAAAADASIDTGHSLQVDLMTAGEFAFVVAAYNNKVEGDRNAGAPIGWRDPHVVEPVVFTWNGISIPRNITQPATALLFADFMLTEGQELYAQNDAVALRQGIEGMDVLTSGFELLAMTSETAVDERQKWSDIYLDRVLGQ